MHGSNFTSYNAYLAFCNKLVNALLAADKDNDGNSDGKLESGALTAIEDAIKDNKATYLSSECDTIGEYQKFYDVYLDYRAKLDEANDNGINSWVSDQASGRNAAWPDEGWKKVMSDYHGAAEPEKACPLVNAIPQAPNRMYYVIEAANDFIDQFLALNEKNRISVVVYDSVATVLMPLAHYTKNGNNDYLSAQKHHWQSWGNGQWACTVSAEAKPVDGYANERDTFGALLQGNVYRASVTSWSNTDTMAAINAGLDILANSANSYSDMQERTPIMVLMTDGAANAILTGIEGNAEIAAQNYAKAWTTGAKKSTTGTAVPFNRYDGMVLDQIVKNDNSTSTRTYNMLNGTNTFHDQTSAGLTVYGAGSGHIYGSETDMPIRYTVVLHTLLSAAFQKTLVEKHYNNGRDYAAVPDAEKEDWTKALIYTIGFGIDSYEGDDMRRICGEVLNPSKTFQAPEGTIGADSNIFQQYTDWQENGTEIVRNFNPSARDSSIDGTPNTTLSLSFNVADTDLDGTGVTKADIERNIRYNQEYFEASLTAADENSKTLEGVFRQILEMIQGEMFSPVAGSNDLGVSDAITYMDPVGKYMEIKDVKNLLLFGRLYEMIRAGVYDYDFNYAWVGEHGTFDEGWYKGDDPQTAVRAAETVTTDYGSYPAGIAGISNAEDAWNAGWVYRLGYQTAQQFVPTLSTEEAEPGDNPVSSKQQQTTYTFYRLKLNKEERRALHMNPAFGTDADITSEMKKEHEKDLTGEVHLQHNGVYTLSDVRVWVEETGDYNDQQVQDGHMEMDANFDEALFVSLPANILPISTVTLNKGMGDSWTYVKNESFPLRVFYTVGIQASMLTEEGTINIAGGVSPEYIEANKVATDVAQTARGVAKGNMEFFSNWYNVEKRYSDYATTNTDYTYGDTVVTFSPSTLNRYYIFKKPLPLYNTAYVWVPKEGNSAGTGSSAADGDWRKVVLAETGSEESSGESDVRTFDPVNFGGNLLKSDLEPEPVTSAEENQTNMWIALKNAGINQAQPGDIVLLKRHRLDDVTKEEGADDPFPSAGYFYMAIDYYELGPDDSARPVQYVVARKGSEFGSAYAASGITNGGMLCWYDVSGHNDEIYPYNSYTDTGDKTRGKAYIGAPLDSDGKYAASGDVKLDDNGLPDAASRESHPEWGSSYKDGTWVLATRPGGLRVGALAQSVCGKTDAGSTYVEYADYALERFGESEDSDPQKPTPRLSVGYYGGNTTRTANNYYMATISTSSSTEDEDVVVNSYLGNNGRLIMEDTTLLLTKTLVDGASGLPQGKEGEDAQEFDFQVYVEGWTGAHDAVMVRYNPSLKTWQRQLHYIDLELDSKLCLQNTDGSQVKVNADGTPYTEDPAETPYYVYIGTNAFSSAEIVSSPTAMRVYHNDLHETTGSGSIGEGDIVCEYYSYDAQGEPVLVDSSEIDENEKYTLMRKFSAAKVWLLTQEQYDAFAGEQDSDGSPKIEGVSGSAPIQLDKFYLLTLDPLVDSEGSEIKVDSPYRTLSAYLNETVYFGYQYGKEAVEGNELTGDDLYDKTLTAGGKDADAVAANTAEVKLQSGCGLLFSSIPMNTGYRLTERLDQGQMEDGYRFYHVKQVTEAGTKTLPASAFQAAADGVYSVNGTTGIVEEAGHYNNIWSTDKTETYIDETKVPDDPVVMDKPGVQMKPGVQVGNKITYQIKWKNTEDDAAQISIIDPLDQGVDFVGASWDKLELKAEAGFASNDGYATGSTAPMIQYNKASHTVTWDLGEQAPGESGFVTLIVRVNENAPKYWNDYEEETIKPEQDSLVRNRAELRVAENSYNTNVVLNPVGGPSKTETQIEHVQDKVILKKGEDFALEPGSDDKYHGPLVFAGDRITYEISWQNYKETEASITLRDPLDSHVRFVSASFDPADTVDGSGQKPGSASPAKTVLTAQDENAQSMKSDTKVNVSGEELSIVQYTLGENSVTGETEHEVVWNLGVQPGGASGKVTLVVEVQKSAVPVGFVDNTAYVTVNGDPEQRTVTIENQIPDESKSEVDPGDGVMVRYGQPIDYQIHWQNYQPENATVTILDKLDPGVDFVEAAYKDVKLKAQEVAAGTASKTGMVARTDGTEAKVTVSYDKTAHEVTWKLEEQLPKGNGDVTLKVMTNKDARLSYKYDAKAENFVTGTEKDYEVLNQARVQVGNDDFIKTELVKNPVPEKTETYVKREGVEPEESVTLSWKEEEGNKPTLTGPLVFVGDTITYEIHWTNGHDQAADVTITDELDPGVTFQWASDEGSLSENDGIFTVTWILKDRPANTSGTVTLKVDVNEKATPVGLVDNQAFVMVGADPAVETEIIENPTPKVEKTEITPGQGESVMPGDEIEYEISWHNYEETAADVTISDKLDPGVDFLSAAYGDEILKVEISGNAGIMGIAENVVSPGDAEKNEVSSGDADETQLTFFGMTIDLPVTGDEPLEYKFTDEYGGGSILYYPQSHRVEWILKARPENTGGVVELKVVVNDDANQMWDYDSTELSGTELDFQVLNQAGVKVGDDPEVKTRIIENPTRPRKTETHVSDREVSGELVAEPGGYAGPKVKVGDTITYRITWQNSAVDAAGMPARAEITVIDELDPGVDFVSAVGSDGSEGHYDPATHTVTWELGEKEARDHGFVTLTVRVNDQALLPEKVENDAVVHVGNTVFVTDKVVNPVGDTGNLTVSKTVSGDLGDKERAFRFTVKLEDTNIDGRYGDMFFVSGVATFDLKHGESASAIELPAGVKYHVTEEDYSQDGYRTSVNGEPDAAIVGGKTGSVDFVNWKESGDKPRKTETTPGNEKMVVPGEEITYEIVWQNYELGGADIQIRDPLDEGVNFVSADNGGIYDVDTHTVTWNFHVAVQAIGKVSLTVRVNEKAKKDDSIVRNQAFVKVGNQPEVATEIPENPVPDPHKKEVTPGDKRMVQPGELIIYEVSWQNPDPDAADVVIRDPLDPGVDFISASENGAYDRAAHTVTWKFRAEAETTGKVSLTVRVNEKAKQDDGIVRNQAFVKVGNHPEVATEIPENPVPDPHKIETDPGDGELVRPEDLITYQISWQNYENQAAKVVIRDPLDPNVTFTSASKGGIYDPQTHTVTWTLEAQAVEKGTVTLTVEVNKEAEAQGYVRNQAFVKVGNHAEIATEIPENPVPETPPETPPTETTPETPPTETPPETPPTETTPETPPTETPPETPPTETPPETPPTETTPETPPTETPPETPPVETPPETPPVETPPETPPVETPPETPPVETPPETPPTETPPETPPVETPPETPPVETPPETPPVETPPETPPVETPPETPPVETPSEQTPPEETPDVVPRTGDNSCLGTCSAVLMMSLAAAALAAASLGDRRRRRR